MRNKLYLTSFILFLINLLFVSSALAQPCVGFDSGKGNFSTNVSCRGGSDGTITVNVIPGAKGLYYQLDRFIPGSGYVTEAGPIGDAVGNPLFTTTYTFTGLRASLYYIVRLLDGDDINCPDVASTFIQVRQPAAVLSINPVATNVSGCIGNNNGAINASASGGNGNYQFSFNGGPYGSQNSWTNLIAGSYIISVKDIKNCVKDSTVTLTQPTQVTASLVGTNPLCNGNSNGSITVSAFGGTPGYTYSLNGGPFQPSNVFSGLISGSYSVQVKDANGCGLVSPATITLTQPNLLNISLTSKLDIANCFGDATGQIIADITGGTAPYQYAVNGGAFQAVAGNNITLNNLLGGDYIISVQDANNCVVNLPKVTIAQPPLLNPVFASQINVDCKGNSTGNITINVSGGTPAYSYSINGGPFTTGGNSFSFNNLSAGSYNISVKDSKGCTSTLAPIVITEPLILTISPSTQSDVTCNGKNDGTIGVIVNGGTAPYSFSINGSVFSIGSGNFSNLAPGTYIIDVKDANGCTATLPGIVINQPPVLVINLSTKVDVTGCAGNLNGSIDVAGFGGVAPYQYSINGGPFSSSSSFTSLGAGTYNITIKDANNCLATLAPVTITEPTAITVGSGTITNASCNGKTDGSFVVNFSGGTPSYQYSLNGGAFIAATSPLTLSNLSAGTYNITIKDANNCLATLAPVTITEPTAITVGSGTITNASCNGKTDGSFVVNFSGGTPSYQYSLNGGAFIAATSPLTLSNLSAGTYNITIKDANNCLATLAPVTITEPTAITVGSGTITNASCNGKTDGSFVVNFSGGTPSYQYSLNGGAFIAATSPLTLSNLSAGTYNITIKDANNCLATLAPVTITEPTAITVGSGTITNASCNGKTDGSFVVNFSGGTPSYQYSLNGGAFIAATSPLTLSNLSAGTYNITIKDANNCLATLAPVTITEPTAITVGSGTITNASCNGKTDGSFVVNFSGGTPSYQYSLNGGAFIAATSPLTLSNLSAGTYNITIKDANNCLATLAPVTITEPTAITVGSGTITNASCNGKTDGSFVVNFSGGTPSYQYSLNGGAFIAATSPLTLSNLSAGTYNITIKDANNCLATLAPVTITEPTAITVGSGTITNASCNGKTDGSFVVNFSGGTPSYQYSLNGGAFIAATSPLTLSNLSAGTYNITIKDANNCLATLAPVTITEPTAITVGSGTITNASCNGKTDGSFVVNFSGGTPSYQYSLNGGAFIAATSPLTLSNLSAGTYNITIKDANNCLATLAPVTITEPTAITVGSGTITNASCNGKTDGSFVVNFSGGTPSYQYSLNGGAFIAATSPLTLSNLSAGTYNITIKDANNCLATLAPVTITEPTAITVGSGTITNASCNGKTDGSFVVNFSGGTPSYQYSLNGGAFIAATSPLTLSNLSAGTYNITIKDANNCLATLAPVTITEPTAITVGSGTITNASCNGKTDGSFVVNFSGGTPSYQYSLNGGAFIAATSPLTLSNLSAGTYNITIKDANNCLATLAPVTITEPTAITVGSGTITNASCNGKTDGSFVVNFSGGTPSYQYSLNGGAFIAATSPLTLSNLSAGTYNITIKDANNCLATLAPVNITEPLILSLSINSQTNIDACGGIPTGSITLNATGGTTSYQYSINGGPFQASNIFSGLSAGNYTIVIQDANNCTQSVSTIITSAPINLTATANPQDVSCIGGNDGQIIVTNTTGGSGVYEYNLNGGTFQSGNIFTGLLSGTYSISVRDKNNPSCLINISSTIGQPSTGVTATFSQINVTGCAGSSNGQINVTPSGGTGPYEYSLNGGVFAAGSGIFNNLKAGNYNIIIRDSKLCTFSLPVITITEPAPVLLSVTSKADVTGCNGDATGSVSLSATGGSPGYQFSINNGAFQAGNTFSNLPAGNYTIVGQDINNCADTISVIINQPGPLSSTFTKIDPGCGAGNTGSISTNVTGGTAPYSYSINGSVFAAGTGNFANLPGGNYDITVKDKNGCTFIIPTISITAPAILSSTVSSANPTSCNSVDGSITVTLVSGGSGNYQYSLDGITFQISNIFNSLSNGTYTVYIKDVTAGCQITQSASLTSPGGITASFTKQDVSCNGSSNGKITLSGVSGGSGSGYQYSIDGITFQASNVFAGLAANNYTITIKDNASCVTTLSINIGEPAALQASVSAINPTDCSSGNGSITLSGLAGGSGNYEFSLTGALYQTGPSFTNLSPGSYTIYIRDVTNPGCIIIKNQVLTAPNAITATLTSQNVSCNGANDGQINVNPPSGGSGNYEYSINGINFQTLASFSGLVPNNYSIIVRDKNNPTCKISLSASITSPSALNISLINSSSTGCSGSSSGSITVVVSGGAGPYLYSVNGGSFLSGSGTFNNLAAGNYDITVKDANNCLSTLPTVKISNSPALTATITPSDETVCAANDGKIIVSGESGPSGPYQYFINGNPNPAGINNNSFIGLAPGSYLINVIAANNCNFSQTVVVNTPCVPLCNITATAANVPVICNGVNNGQAFLINVAGGSGMYEYNLDGGAYQATSNFTGLGLGNYTIGVRDKKNFPCVVTFPVTVTAKFQVSAIIVVNQPKSCNDKGTIKFTNVFGGTAPYQFSVDGVNFLTDSLFLNLNPGTYSATIKDANNCTLNTSIKIIGSTGISATVTQISPVSCFGGKDGSLGISNVSGGSGTYVYSIDGTNFFGNTIFTNLLAGPYTVYIKDQSGTCISSYPVTIAQPIGITASATSVSPTSCNSKDGSIKINIFTGGVLPYSFSLNGNSPQSDSTFKNLGSGSFTIIISDKNGCTDTLKTTLTAPGGITALPQVISDASCFGSRDGSAQLTNVLGGSGSFEYSIDGINFQTSPVFSNLIGGVYVLTVRDKGIPNPCIVTYGITIKQPSAIKATVVGSNPTSCTSKDGKIDINNVGNGSAPYQYSLDSLINYQSTPTFINLDNGNYKVYIKDSKGCISVFSKIIASPNAVVVSNPVLKAPSCSGMNDGKIDLSSSVSGGTPAYSYSIDGINYQAGAIFQNLLAGNYTVSIKDNSGCIYPFKYTLSDPVGITFTVKNLNPANCGAKTGKVQVSNVSGGIAPYFYSLDNVTFQTNTIFDFLAAGNYKLYVRDNSGGPCPGVQSFVVPGTPPITYKVDTVNIGCKGGSAGQITISKIIGGIKPYKVSIDGGNTFAFVSNDSIAFTNLPPNNYNLVIDYGNSCLTTPQIINITSGNLPIAVNVTGANCGSPTGSATAVVTPNSPNYFYSLDSIKYTTSPVFLNLKPGPYIMYVREGQNDPCLKRKAFIIPGPDSLRFEAKIVECRRIYFTNIVGGTAPYKISLDGGKTFVDNSASIFTNSYITLDLKDGDYTLQITDVNGCNTGIKKVRISSKLLANHHFTNPTRSDSATGSIAILDIQGSNKPFEISTDSLTWKKLSAKKAPYDTIITKLVAGNYNVYIRDANGCVTSYKDLEVKEADFMIPNIFTPGNGDDKNDTFKMVFKDSFTPPENTTLEVYNRWGKVIYTSKNYKNEWNGDNHPDGIYYYYTVIPGHGEFQGWVQIWRGPNAER